MPAQDQLVWRKSSYTAAENCVEVASTATQVAVRDSKQPNGPRLSFSPDDWHRFLTTSR